MKVHAPKALATELLFFPYKFGSVGIGFEYSLLKHEPHGVISMSKHLTKRATAQVQAKTNGSIALRTKYKANRMTTVKATYAVNLIESQHR